MVIVVNVSIRRETLFASMTTLKAWHAGQPGNSSPLLDMDRKVFQAGNDWQMPVAIGLSACEAAGEAIMAIRTFRFYLYHLRKVKGKQQMECRQPSD